jgi:hypothetical protein
MADCNVCCGLGRYPIIDRYGSERYSITCPECDGCGLDDEGQEAAARAIVDRRRYEMAMAETRAARGESDR